MTATPCPVCGGAEVQPAFTRNGFQLARCARCGTLHVNPMPGAAELNAHYQDPAYFSGAAAQGYRSYADMEQALRPHFQRRLRLLGQLVPGRGRLLDFGCAAGYFLRQARAAGWQIAGVEVAAGMAQAAAEALGIPIASSLAESPARDLQAVTLWEVIEHLPQPVEVLRELRQRLTPGGVLMLSTPNTGHWQAIRRPEAWAGYRPPAHVLFFTAQTLVLALERAGFERITVQRTMPLPPLPAWLERLSAPLQAGLADGRARPWRLALWTWRAIRVLGWGWARLAHPSDEVYATLEAAAFRPAEGRA